jgi:hypothetical protein
LGPDIPEDGRLEDRRKNLGYGPSNVADSVYWRDTAEGHVGVGDLAKQTQKRLRVGMMGRTALVSWFI